MSTAFILFFLLLKQSALAAEMELLLVHALWRHGDRSPTKTFPKDPIQEDDWKFGGGGFGQLSPIGMRQHYNLGRQIRRRYIDRLGFLSKKYSSKEIYVRSTDFNRTIISALSNLMGMYGYNHGHSEKNVDYPDVEGWPTGYVPIAVHTVEAATDYLLPAEHESTICKRRNQLRKIAQESEEAKAFLTSHEVVELFKNLTAFCGQNITVNNFWSIRDILMIEQIHKKDRLRNESKWFSDELFKKMTEVDIRIEPYQAATFNKTVTFNNLDLWQEYQKVCGGSLFNDIKMRMDLKWDCLINHHSRCRWIDGLKYFVYSAHDVNVFAFFSILRLLHSEVVMPDGYVPYAAAVFVELWKNNTDGKPYFRLAYHRKPDETGDTIYTITQEIEPCEGKEFCKLDVYRDIAAKVKPDQEMAKLCLIDPNPSSSTESPPSPASTMWQPHFMIALILLSLKWVYF
ncbi:unnamed protein product [Cylicocyclus nassatus]|uniref:Uncharacterized protein n=1 Tax=Cylicocyclus nassatus TaxID=53992 RepID=A0AA36H8I8_CYLNA|nr:unnamed protein product [Cylicocyclus nassatus]